VPIDDDYLFVCGFCVCVFCCHRGVVAVVVAVVAVVIVIVVVIVVFVVVDVIVFFFFFCRCYRVSQVQGHMCGVNKTMIYGPIDIEGHLGTGKNAGT
jgi:hypothetical protein